MFDTHYQNRRVLITGHTGFKGSWLTSWLLELGADIVGFSDQLPSEPSMFDVLGLAERIDDRRADISDAAAVRSALATEPDTIFHLAAQALVKRSYDDPVETFQSNVIGTATLLDEVRRAGRPCTVVMITSDKCYENIEQEAGYHEADRLGGKDPYSASKGAAELVIHAFHHSYFSEPGPIRLAAARAGNVIGGGDWAANRLVPDCVRSWSRDEPVELRRPRATRPWQHVLEPLSGYLHLGQQLAHRDDLHGEAFNFGPPPDADFTVLALLEALAEHYFAGRDALEGEQRLVVNAESGFHEAGLLKLDCSKADQQLGWRAAFDFPRTAEMTAAWYKQFYEASPDAATLRELTRSQIATYVEAARAAKLGWAG